MKKWGNGLLCTATLAFLEYKNEPTRSLLCRYVRGKKAGGWKRPETKGLVLLEASSSLSLHNDSVAGMTFHHVLDSSVGIAHGHQLDPGADTGLGGKLKHLLGDLPATNEGAGNGDVAHQEGAWGDGDGGDLG